MVACKNTNAFNILQTIIPVFYIKMTIPIKTYQLQKNRFYFMHRHLSQLRA